ncbi:MAG: V-type ATP synthase subunit I [Candidatus Micrarchaeaceae archaeon]
MLRTERMQKIRIIALDHVKYDIIRKLHELGVIEIRKSGLELTDDKALNQFPDISARLIKFEGALALLKEPADQKTHVDFRRKHVGLARLLKMSDEFSAVDEVFALNDERKKINEDIKVMDEALDISNMFSGTGVDFGRLKSNRLAFRAFMTNQKGVHIIEDRIESRKIRNMVISKMLPTRDILVFFAFEKSRMKDFDELIRDTDHYEVDMSNKYLNSTPEHVMSSTGKARKAADSRLSEIQKRIGYIGNNYYYDIASLMEMLEIEYDRANVSVNFKKTGKTFIIEGWIPKKNTDQLKDAIRDVTGGRSEVEEIKDNELAPTLINRPGFLRPFDYIMEFFSLPRSDEIDPTYIFIFTLAVFYGLTVSDVGYGLISFIFAYIVAKRTDEYGLMHNVAKIWQMFAISIIFFGLISNQFLGYSIPYFNSIKLFDWTKNITGLILLTIFIGIFMVCLGQVFGFVNNWNAGRRKLAIGKLVSIVAIAFGVIAVGGWLFGAFAHILTIEATFVAIIAIAITAALSGIEAAELTNLISHPLSYIRLLGFGLASVIIASVIDKAFTPSLSLGIPLFILYLIIFIVLHLLNMLMSIFEGIIQSARLNFVEFFSKFYRGNGVKFKPYYFRRRYTKG